MRVLDEFLKDQCRITIFNWNNRYIIKIERENFEQVYKISQFDLDEKTLNRLIDEVFLKETNDRFATMDRTLAEAMERV